ncbi:MAG: hypothetical protein M1609_12280 [Firmicutes bacterium]|nr:hypothetical protein [Bacillota bacterium]
MMGLMIGLVLIAIALFVGFGILAVANNSVRNFKEEEYVNFTQQFIASSKK